MIRNILGGMVLAVCGAIALADTAPAPSAAVHTANDETAVLTAMDRYLAAISASDLDAMASMQTPDGTNYRARALPSGGMEVLGRPNSYWVDPARKDGHAYRERYWSPTVLVRGSIAMVWAPYEFWIDGKTSHCGIDALSFIRVGDEWHVANSMWTVEPDACPELRPADPASIRPAGLSPSGVPYRLQPRGAESRRGCAGESLAEGCAAITPGRLTRDSQTP